MTGYTLVMSGDAPADPVLACQLCHHDLAAGSRWFLVGKDKALRTNANGKDLWRTVCRGCLPRLGLSMVTV